MATRGDENGFARAVQKIADEAAEKVVAAARRNGVEQTVVVTIDELPPESDEAEAPPRVPGVVVADVPVEALGTEELPGEAEDLQGGEVLPEEQATL
jgi:hypothetical protein